MTDLQALHAQTRHSNAPLQMKRSLPGLSPALLGGEGERREGGDSFAGLSSALLFAQTQPLLNCDCGRWLCKFDLASSVLCVVPQVKALCVSACSQSSTQQPDLHLWTLVNQLQSDMKVWGREPTVAQYWTTASAHLGNFICKFSQVSESTHLLHEGKATAGSNEMRGSSIRPNNATAAHNREPYQADTLLPAACSYYISRVWS